MSVILMSSYSHLCPYRRVRLIMCFLADVGLNVSKTKLQLCKTQVKYVGHNHILGPGIRELDPGRVAAITQCPRPLTRETSGVFGVNGILLGLDYGFFN